MVKWAYPADNEMERSWASTIILGRETYSAENPFVSIESLCLLLDLLEKFLYQLPVF